ncbi:MAG: general secretion pathway protein GspD [Algicola sp.]|nr:general secretion pathway protein GspD [Algicola sp.]
MKHIIFIALIFITASLKAQTSEAERLMTIQRKLDSLSITNKGLGETLNTNISPNEVTLTNFLLAVSNVHGISINVAPELDRIKINNNLSNVTVNNVLVFLCREYDLSIEFTGGILSIKPYTPEVLDKTHPINIDYEPLSNHIAIDVRENKLYEVFREIMDKSAKNLMFAPGMENHLLTSYIKATDFDAAMDKLALANGLELTKSKDNFYVFDLRQDEKDTNRPKLSKRLVSGLEFEIIDKQRQLLNVDFKNIPIKDIVQTVGDSLDINIFIASPLDNIGKTTLRTSSISFDELLTKIFEPLVENSNISGNQQVNTGNNNRNSNVDQPKSNNYTFKKDGNIYFFGTANQLSVRKVEIITLRHRSVNLTPDPESMSMLNSVRDNYMVADQGFRNQNGFGTSGNPSRTPNYNNRNTSRNDQETKSILDIVPEEIKSDLDFKVDFELNNIYVTGTGARIEFFKDFIQNIDKTIPVILIEVMIVEAQRSNTLEAGVTWGLGSEPQTTQGSLFPTTDLTLGAQTINKIINGFSSTSVFNFGQVVPNFFATIKAMETNGDLKIKSTPKLATLNGHRASFSNGQTSYYAIVQRNIIGTDNPQTSEIRNYFPIDAKLGLDIKPYVTGDKQVLLDINVIQSSFGQRIADDAPPDINSRNFSSVVRMKDQDIAVLGGLEENYKNNSGSGVPFLARIPIIKWFFSKRVREAKKSKLTVFIKPTVIY